jgi:hypothetical protein
MRFKKTNINRKKGQEVGTRSRNKQQQVAVISCRSRATTTPKEPII